MAARWMLPGRCLGLGCRVSVRGLTVPTSGRCGAAWDGDSEVVSDELERMQLHAFDVAFSVIARERQRGLGLFIAQEHNAATG